MKVVNYQIVCSKFAAWFQTDTKGKILDAAPIIRKFIGQHTSNLEDWVKKISKEEPEIRKLHI